MSNENQAYEAPSISVVGTLAEITQGNKDGQSLDNNFPTNTPKDKLRFDHS